MQFIPAYNQDKQRACLILALGESLKFDGSKRPSYGRQWSRVPRALVAWPDGLIEQVDTEELVIVWSLVPQREGSGLIRPSFDTIEAVYKRLIEEEDNDKVS